MQVIAEVLPADEGPPKDEAPLEEPIAEVIPVGIPEPARPKPQRGSRVVLAEPVKPRRRREPEAAAIPPWLLYGLTVAAGMFLGLVALVMLWLVFRK